MRILFRVLMSLLTLLAMLLLASCTGRSGCPPASTCSQGKGGGGGSSTAAFFYAVNQNGTIDGYALSTTPSQFSAISPYTAPVVPVSNSGVGMAVAQKQFLYAGFASTGQLFGWSIDKTGNLTAISGSPYPASFLSGYIGGVGQANIITDPAGTLLFISDALAGGIYVFQTFSTHTGAQVAAFTIGTGTSLGALTPVPGSPFAFNMWQLMGDPSGKFLVGTTGNATAFSGVDDNNLYLFSITQSGAAAGALTEVTKQATTFSPYSIAMQSNTNGNLIYSFSLNDTATAFNAVEGYSITSTGGLSADTGSPFTGVGNGTWGQLDESGSFLFVYAGFINPSPSTTTTPLTPLAVGAGGALTQPVSTFPLKTPGFWVVTDTH